MSQQAYPAPAAQQAYPVFPESSSASDPTGIGAFGGTFYEITETAVVDVPDALIAEIA